MSIRAVIFDFGGVLVRTEDTSLHQKWERRLGLQEGGLIEVVNHNEPYNRAILGQGTEAEIWQMLASRFQLNTHELDELEQDFTRNDVLDEELALFLANLRPRYKTAILSDAFLGARKVFSQRYGLDTKVDTLIISAEEGLEKPDLRFYQLAAGRLGVALNEILFVDNMLGHIEAARKAGMYAVHFQNTQQAITEVQQHLIPPLRSTP